MSDPAPIPPRKKARSAESRAQRVFTEAAMKSRKKRFQSSVEVINDGTILFIVGEGENAQQRVVGSLTQTTVGQRYKRFIEAKPRFHQYDFFELHQFPTGVDAAANCLFADLDDDDLLDSIVEQLEPIVQLGRDINLQPSNQPDCFVANSIHCLLASELAHDLANFSIKKKNNASEAAPMTPSIRFVKQSSLYDAIKNHRELAARFICDNFNFLVIGHTDYFESKPYPFLAGGEAQDKTFLDWFLQFVSYG
jgi:hypothetical protein